MLENIFQPQMRYGTNTGRSSITTMPIKPMRNTSMFDVSETSRIYRQKLGANKSDEVLGDQDDFKNTTGRYFLRRRHNLPTNVKTV